MYEDSNTAVATEFDVNAPELGAYVPDEVDPNATPVRVYPPPPDDGVHIVVLRINEKNDKGGVYLKGDKDPNTGAVQNAKVVADLVPKFVNEDGTDGQFIKNFYPTSVLMKGQKATAISGLCYLAGRPFTKEVRTLGNQRDFVERLFIEHGEAGVRLKAKTRWVKSHQKVDEFGMPVFKLRNDGSPIIDAKGNPIKEYIEIKGQARIKKLAKITALSEVASWEPNEGESAEDFQKSKDSYVEAAESRAHIFTDPVSGNELQVQVEIDQLVDE